MPRPLTEKTLELNIMAELAHLARLAGHNPYFIGFSQLEELTNGGDSFYNVGSKIGFFQFKRGYRRKKYFTFYINNNRPHFDQHHKLNQTHKICGACRYVFPLVGSNEDVYKNRGNLLVLTPFIPPTKFDLSSEPNKPHLIKMRFNGTWDKLSEVEHGEWRNIFGGLPQDPDTDNAVPIQANVRRIYDDRQTAEEVFNRLELPSIEMVLKSIRENPNSNVQDIFEQRSSFCMIFV
jgi:hypothetical protein